jgi:Uma2 family endonuclease
MKTTLPIRRWRSDEFDKMFECGLLAPRGYELPDGVVYNTQGFVKRWSVYDFDRLAEAGVITPKEHAELIAGSVFEPRSFRPRHSYIRTKLIYLLLEATRDDDSAIVSPTGYVMLSDESIVAPEVCIITREAHEDVETWPRADDVLLVTEIVDPMYATLLDLKLRVYAEFNLQEVWYVDAIRGTLTVHTSPKAGAFQTVAEYGRGESWNSAALKGALIRTTDAVGPKR